MTKHTEIEIRDAFIEKMGLRAQDEGMPPGAGRVFALLVFGGDPVAFGAIAEDLGMSRASVSMAVRLLEARGLARRVKKAKDRQDYFEIVPNAFETILNAARERFDLTRADIEETRDALPDTCAPAKARLTELSDFYKAMSEGLDTTLATFTGTRTLTR